MGKQFIVQATRENIAARLNELNFPDPEKSTVSAETIAQLLNGWLVIVIDEPNGKTCNVKTFKPKHV